MPHKPLQCAGDLPRIILEGGTDGTAIEGDAPDWLVISGHASLAAVAAARLPVRRR